MFLPYVVSKAAVIRLSEELAMETEQYGVAVFAIDPRLDVDGDDELLGQLRTGHPLDAVRPIALRYGSARSHVPRGRPGGHARDRSSGTLSRAATSRSGMTWTTYWVA